MSRPPSADKQPPFTEKHETVSGKALSLGLEKQIRAEEMAMACQNQPDRYESLILAAALAAAGTLFLFDKLGAFAILHLAPAFLVGVGVSLIRAAAVTGPRGSKGSREGRDA